MPADAPRMANLLTNAQGEPINSKTMWLKQRARLKQQWQDFLGPLPKTAVPLKTSVDATEDLPEFTRQHARYQVEAGLFIDGYLLTPKPGEGKLPAVVVFHPTTPFQARGVAGLEDNYPEEKRQGVQLVRRGYIVWCPRNYINADGADWAGNAKRVLTQHTNWTGMTRMVWDAFRAADFVETLPNVDRHRIGCLGHSLGGKEVLYAMAFDERYKAGVSSEGGIGLKFSNWAASWYLGPRITRPDCKLEHDQLLALVAPRAFLLLAGDSADGDRSWAFIQAVRPVYDLLGAPNNLGWFNHHLGHRYAPEARTVAEEFLDRHLKK
jgi:dienelactone hydrolase